MRPLLLPIALTATTKTERAAMATNIGERLVRGPDRLEPPIAARKPSRVWYERAMRFWTYTDWVDPKRSLAIYTVPNLLRPRKLTPIVRRCEWQACRSQLRAMSERIFSDVDVDTTLHRIPASATDRFNDLAWSLFAHTGRFPWARESLDPQMKVAERPPSVVYGVEWADLCGARSIAWIAGADRTLDDAWLNAWNELERCLTPRRLLKRWREAYVLPPSANGSVPAKK